jgi:Ca2+-binding RTX toxin-like protein
MDGGLGIDWADYQDATGGVTVDLALTTAQNTGSMGIDTLSNFEVIAGSAFADVLKAADSGSTIYGFLGNDLLIGRAGNDVLNGGVGADTIQGGGGNDTIFAEDWSSIDSDHVDGGTGVDTIDYATTTGPLTVNLALTTAQNTGSGGIDTIINVENVSGSLYDDVLTGNGVANTLFGWTGNDTLSGAAGNDLLDGFAGADHLFGGAGNDVLMGGVTGLATEVDQLTGGTGADVFVFTDATFSTATGTDQILDFTASQGDKIDLRGLALLAANFIGTADFTGIAGQMHAVDLGGVFRVEVDGNGDGFADGLVIDVTSATALTSADFLF